MNVKIWLVCESFTAGEQSDSFSDDSKSRKVQFHVSTVAGAHTYVCLAFTIIYDLCFDNKRCDSPSVTKLLHFYRKQNNRSIKERFLFKNP